MKSSKLVKDAEMHAEEDKKKRELVETRNQADSLIYSTERSIKDLGDKVDAATRTKVEEASTRCARPWKAKMWPKSSV